MRSAVWLLLLALLDQPAYAQEATTELFVGVRADATPFSYKVTGGESPSRGSLPDGTLRRAGYAGYVVHICDHVLFELESRYRDVKVREVEVDAANRFPRLRQQGERGERIDILCDPSTITDDRLFQFLASPPIYLSGITFASQPDIPQGKPCAAIVGVVEETTSAMNGVRDILSTGNWAVYSDDLWAAIDGGSPPASRETCVSIPDATRTDGGTGLTSRQPAIYMAKTHDELAKAFCRREVLYYVGDVEIVNRKLGTNCTYRDGALTYTDERYAIFARVPDDPGEARKAFLILKFFEFLSRDIHSRNSILIEAFQATFPGYVASPKLQALYWSLTGTYPGAGP